MSIVPEHGVISFARGIPSADILPLSSLAECARRAVVDHGRVALNYGPPGGYSPLRDWLASRHGTTPECVLITPGSLIGLNFVVAALVGAGGRAIVEAPTYDRMLHVLGDHKADVVSVVRSDYGIDLEQLRNLASKIPKPRLLYVLPTFHNPTGRTLGAQDREALAELADELDLPVFEDDPYGAVRFDGDPLPYVHELLRERGRADLALFASSFSKTVAPGLRVGYLLLPEHLVNMVEALATKTYLSPPLLPQAQLFEFVTGGYLEPHLDFLGSALRLRRDALLAVLETEMPSGTRWTRPDGGYFLWLELPEPLDAHEVLEAARAVGVAFVPGSGFFLDGRDRHSARLAFSYPSVDEVREGARRLVGVVQSARAGEI